MSSNAPRPHHPGAGYRRSRGRSFAVSVGLLAAAVASHDAGRTLAGTGDDWRLPQVEQRIRAGLLLVADASMSDPRFAETVILLVHHGDRGSVGLVLNRPSSYQVAEAFPDIEGLADSPEVLYWGGPVAARQASLVLRSESAPAAQAERLVGDVYFVGRAEALVQIFARRRTPTDYRVFVGYAGWAAGQLASELELGAWHLVSVDPRSILGAAPDRLWEELRRASNSLRAARSR